MGYDTKVIKGAPHLTKKTLQVYCNNNTPTPLEDVLKSEQTGVWRLGDDTVDGLTNVEVYHEETKTKIRGLITEIEYHTKNEEHGGGYVISFTPLENKEGRVITSYGSTRPKFNNIGWAIK